MAIVLIDKIAPKNAAFIGMVSANQVIGTNPGGTGSYLPSSCIKIDSISEPYLNISNGPTAGYYLKYKDDIDKLTWSEVVGGSDVAWSGAYQFYAVSSLNKIQYNQYVGSSGNRSLYYPSSVGHFFTNSGAKLTSAYNSGQRVLDLFNHTLYITSSNLITNYANSSNVRFRFPASSTAKSIFAGSANVNIKTSGSLHNLWNWSSNKSWYANSSNVRFRFPASSTAITRYADSSNIRFKYKNSSNVWVFASSQNLSGQLVAIHSAKDINAWNSALWHNSSLIWSNTIGKWLAKKSGAAAGGGSPGGAAGDVQYQVNATTFGGESVFNYNSTTDTLKVIGAISGTNIYGTKIRCSGLSVGISAQTVNYTADTEDTVILCNGSFTVTLPAVAGCEGKLYMIKNIGTGTITVDGNASEEIDNETTQTLSPNSCMNIISDKSGWWII